MIFKTILHTIKNRSNATLDAWAYQCESILAQRSRRIQQLFSFYHRVYGTNGLRLIFHSYHRQFKPPIKSFVMSAVGAVGISISDLGGGRFDWKKDRLSLSNFDSCNRDIEFLSTIPNNKLCSLCKEKQMKYCYCLVGNKKCPTPGKAEGSIKACRKPLNLQSDGPFGNAVIESADENSWEPYFSKNEFSIWRREERTAMYSYKVYARFEDITATDLLHVQTDINFRREWDETAVQLEVVEEDPEPGTNSHLIYWEMQWPKFFSNRDYVYTRRYVKDDIRKVLMICSRGCEHPTFPEFKNKVRVKDYWSLMVIKPYRNFHEPGVHYILTYYDDPGIPIPQNLKSWVTQKQMPDFLKKMYNATKKYCCKKAIEMGHLHEIENYSIINNDYVGNHARRSHVRLWPKRETGK